MQNPLLTISPRIQKLSQILQDFVENECIPAEVIYDAQVNVGNQRWDYVPPIIEELKQKAKTLGLWNLFLSQVYKESYGFTNLEYAVLCETIGKSFLAPEATNTSAPDTGNMEVLARYGTEVQKEKWLKPLMDGSIRSAFCMTEPAVASSDATNIQSSIRCEGNEYVINGRKWWISGAGDPRTEILFVMGKTDPHNTSIHKQQSIILVPSDTPGIHIVRPMKLFGYDDAPHGHMEMVFENVRVPVNNVILGEGRGFEVMQGRLGPGRIHHCMRAIGMAERALELHILRLTDPSRKAFGRLLGEHGTAYDSVCQSRLELDQARLLVLTAAAEMDRSGPKAAMNQIAMAKIVVPQVALNVIDRSIQAHGAAGVGQDLPLAKMFAFMRTLRIADGPDEVHRRQVSKNEMRRALQIRKMYANRGKAHL